MDRVYAVLEILNINPCHLTTSEHWATAVQSLRNLLFTVLGSSIDDIFKLKVARSILKLEFRMEPPKRSWDINDDHHLDCLLKLLDRQVYLSRKENPPSEEYEEILVHILRALSRTRDATLIWTEALVQNLWFALSLDRPQEVRIAAFRVITVFSSNIPSTENKELLVKICRDTSSMLQKFWSSLPLESHKEHALDYSWAISEIGDAPESHLFLFHDQWNVVEDILEAGSRTYVLNIGVAIAGSLPKLIREERNEDATKLWLKLTKRYLSSWWFRTRLPVAEIEKAAAEVLGTGDAEGGVEGDLIQLMAPGSTVSTP